MNLFQRYLADEFAEDYTEGRLSRREALKLITSVTGSLLLANSILAGCVAPEERVPAGPTNAPTALSTASPSKEPPYGTVMPDDPAMIAREVQIPASDTTIMGYLARPASSEVAPVILVCHENRGLTAHIQDVTRRFAFTAGWQRGSR